MTTELDIAKYLMAYPDIRLAILFGSLARGRARSHSDLDIAIAGARPFQAQEKRALIEGLAMLAGRPVDLVDLHSADGLILAQALTTGKILHCTDRMLYAMLIKKMLFTNADMMPYHRRILAERRKAWISA